jgi:hypothetical protein
MLDPQPHSSHFLKFSPLPLSADSHVRLFFASVARGRAGKGRVGMILSGIPYRFHSAIPPATPSVRSFFV